MNWYQFDFNLIVLVLGILHHLYTRGRSYFITRNYYTCMVIVLVNIFATMIWIIIATSTYTPALFEARLNAGEKIASREPSFQGGQPFSILTFIYPLRNIDVVRETFDVRNYSEKPHYPNGDYVKSCCSNYEIPTGEWEDTLRLDVIKAPRFVQEGDLLPVIFNIHGGGYTAGSRDHTYEVLPVLAQGYAIVSISYRLLHFGYIINDMLADITDAFEWVISEGPKYGLDPSRILFVGNSAGGHLALLSSTFINEKHPGRVKAVVSIAGATEFIWFWDKWTKGEVRVDERFLQLFLKLVNGTGYDDPDLSAKISSISPSSYLKNVNFTIISIHGQGDLLVPHEMSVLFHEKLEKERIPNYLLSMPFTGHGGPILQQYTTHIVERCAGKFFI